jgi:preprotein translocase subunit SecE
VSDENNKETKTNEEVRSSSSKGGNRIGNIVRTYRAEFRKIVWPSRQTTIKHTITVIFVSLIFGAYISLADGFFGILFSQFVNLVG